MAIRIEALLKQIIKTEPEAQQAASEISDLMWKRVKEGRFPAEEKSVYTHPLFRFDSGQEILNINGNDVFLRRAESRVLALLCASPNEFISRKKLAEEIQNSHRLTRSSVRLAVFGLRKKIVNGRDVENPIETKIRVGYRLVDSSRKPAVVDIA